MPQHGPAFLQGRARYAPIAASVHNSMDFRSSSTWAQIEPGITAGAEARARSRPDGFSRATCECYMRHAKAFV